MIYRMQNWLFVLLSSICHIIENNMASLGRLYDNGLYKSLALAGCMNSVLWL